MQRRDIAKTLLASAAGSMLVPEPSRAQSTCNAPCYTQTAAELRAGVVPVKPQYEPFNLLRYGADPNGGNPQANDAAMAAAIDTCGVTGGTICLPAGFYKFSNPINLISKRNISIRGAGGVSGGAQCATFIDYIGALGPFIDMSGAFGCSLSDMQIVFTDTAFNGKTLLKIGHAAGLDAFMTAVTNCTIGGSTGTGCTHLDLDGAILFTAENCNFTFGNPSVTGRSATGRDYANVIRFRDCVWGSSRVAPIWYGGQAWRFDGCTFENLLNGGAGAFVSGTGIDSQGLTFDSCWFGDATAPSGLWVGVRGSAFRFTGNYVSTAGAPATTGISLNGVDGFTIEGNHFENLETAIGFDAPNNRGGSIKNNRFRSVITVLSNAPNASPYLDLDPNEPMLGTVAGVRSFGTSGFEYSRGGLLRQWGVVTVGSGGAKAVSFPRAFNAVWGVQLTLATPPGNDNRTYASAVTPSGFNVHVAGTPGSATVYWQAHGN